MIKSVIRFVLAVLMVFAGSASVYGDHYEGNLFVGAKGGLSLSRTMFNPSVYQSFKPGATAGFMFRYIEENHFGLIAELDFEQRGWKENFREETHYRYSRTINYIQIPLLAHIYFGSPRAHFFVNAGPEIGFRIGESTSANFDPELISSLPDFPSGHRQTAQLTLPADKIFDYGISGGLGAEFFSNKAGSWLLEARFYYGLGNVVDCGRTQTFSSANAMSLMITAGYWFQIK